MNLGNMLINRKNINKGEVKDINLLNGVYVPQEFRKKVLKHLILNYSGTINGLHPSLFLAIQGFRGQGKTFMLETICKCYDLELIYVSGSDLCGPNEGDSKNKIQSIYEKSCIKLSKTNKLSVIVIDDFHLSIASNLGENVSKTTNAQVLIGYLMNLSDNPYLFNVKVPIILLGNNFTNIYPALTRNGRMDFYSWIPSLSEKKNIVYYMYKKYYNNIDIDDVESLVSLFPEKHISFFKDVIQDIFFSNFDLVVNKFEERKGKFLLGEINDLVKENLNVNTKLSLDNLTKAAYNRNSIKEENFDNAIKRDKDIQARGEEPAERAILVQRFSINYT